MNSDESFSTSLEARVRTALADRYVIEQRIGSGGMATVYLATDPRHQRQVAIKVLRAELASALGSERFLREIRIAAKLQHPHVLPLLDSGDADGLLYYVMPFVQGESLRQRLVREGPLPIAEAVRILRDVADALAYAHSQNVVHRDVKPDNIMLSARHAVLMDFGVAKAVSQAAQEGSATLTTRGLSIGTPAYMAPEQALADPQLDHRVDVYALGIVAYEMLAGALPFEATTPEAMLSAQVTQPPKPVAERREGVPAALAELVMRCLEKRREDRWRSAEAVVSQLEMLATPSGGTASVRPYRRRKQELLVAAVSVVFLGAGAVYLLRPRLHGTMLAATSRQLTFSGNVWEAMISPDGRYIAYFESGVGQTCSGPLHLEEIEGGQPVERGSFKCIAAVRWTADGKGVLVGGILDSLQGTWRLPVIGGSPRAETGIRSPDEKRVLRSSSSTAAGPTAVTVQDAGANAADTIAVLGAGEIADGTWAPSGGAIALWTRTGSDSSTLECVPLSARTRHMVLDVSTSPVSYWWGGRGGETLYYTRRDGARLQLWKVHLSPHNCAGGDRPTLLIPSLERGAHGNGADGSDRISVSADGRRLVFIHSSQHSNIFELAVDSRSRTLSSPHPLTTGTSSINGMQLSQDGTQIAFSVLGQSGNDVFVMPLVGGAPRQLTYLNLRNGANIAWSADGKAVAFCAEDNSGWHVWTVSLTGGAARRIAGSRPIQWCYMAWESPRRLLYTGVHPGLPTASYGPLREIDLVTEQDRAVLAPETSTLSMPQVSPDGRVIAVSSLSGPPDWINEMWTMSLEDSSRRKVMSGVSAPLRWTRDGQSIFAALFFDPFRIVRVPRQGGASTLIGEMPVGWHCNDVDITPDGRRVLCSRDESTNDAWMIEHFDPEAEEDL